MYVRAYAKLNLALSVGPPDPSSRLHPIASWMHSIDLFDELTIEARAGDARGASRRPPRNSDFEIAWATDAPLPSEIDWGPDQDLGMQALRVLEGHIGEPLPVRIRIKKRIPVGGGLGGGSSDAAAVMLAINELFALGLAPPDLVRLSRAVGTDVAFFLDEHAPPRAAVVTGFGDRLERRPPIAAEVVLILPPFGCPTGEVYAAFDRGTNAELRDSEIAALADAPEIASAALFNDLAAAAASVRPELLSLRSRLAAATEEPIHLTGSGSTLFVLTGDPETVAERLAVAAPEAAVVRTRLV